MPILPGELKKAKYLVGVFSRIAHSTPYEDFEWDAAGMIAECGGR